MKRLKSTYAKDTKDLFYAFAKIKSPDESAKFLRDLCTLEEIQEMSRRWKAARMLNRGMPYRAIAQATGLSTTTVTRVSYWLNNGMDGYKLILRRIKENK